MGQQRAATVAKRKDKCKKRDQLLAIQRARLERVLGQIGLGDWCRRLREEFKHLLCRMFNPDLRVMPDDARPADHHLEAKAKILQRELDRLAIRVGNNHLTFKDYHSVVLMLLSMFRAGRADKALQDLVSGSAAIVEGFVGAYDERVWVAFRSRVLASLSEFGSIDTTIYSARLEHVPVGSRTVLLLKLQRTAVLTCTLEVDGVRRKAYRCGDFYELDTGRVVWVEWDAEALGLGAAGRLPVYIQSHAIHQIHRRLGIKPRHLVDHSLRQSLHEAVPRPAPGGGYWIEYRFCDLKLGYLIAEVIGGVVLVRTFLLITMQGTPEGSKFARRLRLRRPDIEYLGLDRLGNLVTTDLTLDADTADLLRDCGCGGVIDLAQRVLGCSSVDGYAEFVKSYAVRTLRGGSARQRLSCL